MAVGTVEPQPGTLEFAMSCLAIGIIPDDRSMRNGTQIRE
jgi:hypothetical protein